MKRSDYFFKKRKMSQKLCNFKTSVIQSLPKKVIPVELLVDHLALLYITESVRM